ncbi:MAG: 30S ribosomal protein S16 [Patescibacteria group bacterium]
MLKIRLTRVGRKHDPYYRVIVTDSRKAPRSGAYLEVLGSYNPRTKNETQLKEDRIKYWLSQGAQTSNTVHNLFVSNKVVEGEKRKIFIKPKRKQSIKESEKVESAEKKPVDKSVEEAKTEPEVKPEEPKEEEEKEA